MRTIQLSDEAALEIHTAIASSVPVPVASGNFPVFPSQGPTLEPIWTKEDGIMAGLAWVSNSVLAGKREAFDTEIYRHFEPGWFNLGNNLSPVRFRLAVGRMDGYDPFKQAAQALQIGQTPEQIYAGMASLNDGFSSAFGACTIDDIRGMQGILRQYGVI